MNKMDKEDLKKFLEQTYGQKKYKKDKSPKVVEEKSNKEKFSKIKEKLGCGECSKS